MPVTICQTLPGNISVSVSELDDMDAFKFGLGLLENDDLFFMKKKCKKQEYKQAVEKEIARRVKVKISEWGEAKGIENHE